MSKIYVFLVQSKTANKPSAKITQSGRLIHCKYTDIIYSFDLKWTLNFKVDLGLFTKTKSWINQKKTKNFKHRGHFEKLKTYYCVTELNKLHNRCSIVFQKMLFSLIAFTSYKTGQSLLYMKVKWEGSGKNRLKFIKLVEHKQDSCLKKLR